MSRKAGARRLMIGEDLVVFVEIPAGSRNKYEYDQALGGIVLDRRLFTAMAYPSDYGYIDGTVGEDGDPLDTLVLVADPTFPGCRIRVRPISCSGCKTRRAGMTRCCVCPWAIRTSKTSSMSATS
jgi:inorganic pyrophosphatase